MARPCSICSHAERDAIDRALVTSASLRHLAERYETSTAALSRHRADHLAPLVAEAKRRDDEARETHAVTIARTIRDKEEWQDERALDVIKQLRAINGASLQILNEARQGKDPQTALKAVDRIQRQIELQAKLLGQLDERPQVNVVVSPEWAAIRATVLVALRPYPEARVAVVERLAALDTPASGVA